MLTALIFTWFALTNAKFCNESAACMEKPDLRLMNRVKHLITRSREICDAEKKCPKNVSSSIGISNEKPCVNGMAGEYPCSNIDLLSFLTFKDLGSESRKPEGNDIWGWEDEHGNLFALTGQTDGASMIDVTDPANPNVIGFFPSVVNRKLIWRDIKTYKNYAFIVADGRFHGMQVYDLNRVLKESKILKEKNNDVIPHFKEDAYYDEFVKSHNIFINEDSGFAYSVGTNTCRGGLHVVDIRDPLHPSFAGCFKEDGYTHDVQCVMYKGPDSRYTGKEICFAFNEDSMAIVDVSNKDEMKMLSRSVYEGIEYCHQGWLTYDQKFLVVNDEMDEYENSNHADGRTETYVWDVEDLENPKLVQTYFAKDKSIDHNLYVIGNLVYETNYENGLRVLNLADIWNGGNLKEVAYFDVHPERNGVDFFGAWSSYPFWLPKKNFLVVQSIDRGFFVLRVAESVLNQTGNYVL